MYVFVPEPADLIPHKPLGLPVAQCLPRLKWVHFHLCAFAIPITNRAMLFGINLHLSFALLSTSAAQSLLNMTKGVPSHYPLTLECQTFTSSLDTCC